MYTLSFAVEVNPEGATPVLTAEQVWKGLEMKAENAVPFVPGMTRCEVIERQGNTLLREITVPGGNYTELIRFYAPVQVQFERVGSGGFIENTISESERGLLLTFTFGLPFPGTEAGSAEERAKGESMREGYIAAIAATLKKVRELVTAREI
ncbi:SRPBCC family protein [Labrys portucalensis]|uniref:SRPBCC family protein n=1 Tax=Labrys neptuniae TaxID=376174 RepID=A0ABV6ZRS4_9HYPH